MSKAAVEAVAVDDGPEVDLHDAMEHMKMFIADLEAGRGPSRIDKLREEIAVLERQNQLLDEQDTAAKRYILLGLAARTFDEIAEAYVFQGAGNGSLDTLSLEE